LSLLVCRSTLAANRQRQIIVSCTPKASAIVIRYYVAP
jgi:hypothetical protein